MAPKKHTILETWPGIKKDMLGFLSDTDAWVITELKKAYEVQDWTTVKKVLDIMDSLHNLAHSH
ncbi:MAG: hypothetical protein U1D67_11055 [Dehalococcoidia bacterium]|nr:hypothetical protein [Dehalococcoidia bacterium]MDZ4247639.1 hypothetical protein [Dehalococcoidia bacterium]